MSFDDETTVKSQLDARLRELVTADQITESIYLAAVDRPAIACGILMGYLETCWDLPPAIHPLSRS